MILLDGGRRLLVGQLQRDAQLHKAIAARVRKIGHHIVQRQEGGHRDGGAGALVTICAVVLALHHQHIGRSSHNGQHGHDGHDDNQLLAFARSGRGDIGVG